MDKLLLPLVIGELRAKGPAEAWESRASDLPRIDQQSSPRPEPSVSAFGRASTSARLAPRSLGKVLAQVVRGAGLQCPPVPHHRLDSVGALGSREGLVLALAAGDHGDRGHVVGKVLVDLPGGRALHSSKRKHAG